MTIKAVVFDAYGTLYDIQSVAAVTEQAFPGYGEIITQIWRIKQLEYTWLRSLMRRYEDFTVVTRESLVYTLRILGLKHDSRVLERILEKYLHLDLYPDADAALAGMRAANWRSFPTAAPRCFMRWCATADSTACWTPPSASTPKDFQARTGCLQPDRIGARHAAR